MTSWSAFLEDLAECLPPVLALEGVRLFDEVSAILVVGYAYVATR